MLHDIYLLGALAMQSAGTLVKMDDCADVSFSGRRRADPSIFLKTRCTPFTAYKSVGG